MKVGRRRRSVLAVGATIAFFRQWRFAVATKIASFFGKVDPAVPILIVSERSDKDFRCKLTTEVGGYPILVKIGQLWSGLQVSSLNRFERGRSHSVEHTLAQVG